MTNHNEANSIFILSDLFLNLARSLYCFSLYLARSLYCFSLYLARSLYCFSLYLVNYQDLLF